jgi:hypothetical protein
VLVVFVLVFVVVVGLLTRLAIRFYFDPYADCGAQRY